MVAVAMTDAGVSYLATITTGVQPGDSLGNVLLQPNQAHATISGQLTANFGPPTDYAGYTHVVVSALQSIMVGSYSVLATIPLLLVYASGLRSSVTGNGAYQVAVPAANPRVGAFVPNGTTHQQDTSTPPAYQLNVQSSCNPATVQTQSAIGVSAGANVPAPTLALTGCPPA